MEVKTEGSTVLVVMTIEVVVEEIVELISAQDVGAGIDHSASRQVLVVGGVFTTVELVHNHFPYSVTPGGAALEVSMAAVRHPKVHSVGP